MAYKRTTEYYKTAFNISLKYISAEILKYKDNSGFLLRIYHVVNNRSLYQQKFTTLQSLYAFIDYDNTNEAEALNTLLNKTINYKEPIF